MLFKVSAFHVYSHQNDSCVDQCSICDMALHSQDVELSTPPEIVLPNAVKLIPFSERHFTFVSSITTNKVYHTLYGRPPPSLG